MAYFQAVAACCLRQPSKSASLLGARKDAPRALKGGSRRPKLSAVPAIVVLGSDNATDGLSGGAGQGGGSNGPWRGNFFYTPFEGSIRVPAIVRYLTTEVVTWSAAEDNCPLPGLPESSKVDLQAGEEHQ
jgi:hypothetical protein